MSTLSRVAGTAILVLMFALAVAGAASAMTTTIRCPNDRDWGLSAGYGKFYCAGTDGNDYMIGTDHADYIDPMRGDDVIRAGRGADRVTTGDSDWLFGDKVYYVGPGDDNVEGQLNSETYHGGYGDDLLSDFKSYTNPDTFHCGPGYDTVEANQGLDKVASDCEDVYWEPQPTS